MKLKVEICADFETTTNKLENAYKNLREQSKSFMFENPQVYSWAFIGSLDYIKYFPKNKDWKYKIDNDNNIFYCYGIEIYTFLFCIMNVKCDLEVIFHNLKGFDGHYILPALYEMNFKRVPIHYDEKSYRIDEIKKIYKLNNVNKYHFQKLLPFEFWEMSNKNAKIYEIKIASLMYKGKKPRTITIKDNLLLFVGNIKQFGNILKDNAINSGVKPKEALKLWCKEDNDYLKYKPYRSIKELENDNSELSYLLKDVKILYFFRKAMEDVYPKKYWHLTAASTAYHDWVRRLGDKLFNQEDYKIVKLKNGVIKYKYNNKLYYDYEIKKMLVKAKIDISWLDDYYNDDMTIGEYININYYSGGISWTNEKHRGKHIKNVYIFDRTSSYPSIMNSNRLFPINRPYIGDKKGCKYKLMKLIILKDIKNKNGLPFMKEAYSSRREYNPILLKDEVYFIDSFEYEKFIKYYNPKKDSYLINVEFSFDTIEAKSIFGDYVNFWFEKKVEGKKTKNVFLEKLAKLFLNSLYGKFGQKTIRIYKVYDNYKWVELKERNDAKYYLPWACAITSSGRMALVEAVDIYNKYVIGGDTDSIMWIGNDEVNFKGKMNVKYDGWELENEKPMEGIFRRPKQYMYSNQEKRKIAFAGINLHIEDDNLNTFFENITFKQFKWGCEIPHQKTPLRTPTGIIIDEIVKKIPPIWDYPPLKYQINYRREDYK